jgi:SAM-dependent MidA family methyltransferase
MVQLITEHGGWIGFDRFMALALYAPGWGYYLRGDGQIGNLPVGPRGQASDFATAPGISPLFGRALAVQVGEALQRSGTEDIWEFGAGSGAMAAQLLGALGDQVRSYTIVDLSGSLQQRQRQTLAGFGDRVTWATQLPGTLHGVVVGNEVLDAMPVKLLARIGGQWNERGVGLGADGGLCWRDRPTVLRPPMEITGEHDYLTEIHPQAEAFMATLVDRLARGAAFLIDYGFSEREYYHPQRHMGTVMCHRAHRADDDPLADVGAKDITAHVNFTGIALAAQQAAAQQVVEGQAVEGQVVEGQVVEGQVVEGQVVEGQVGQPEGHRRGGGQGGIGCVDGDWHLLGYTSQARFLLNCGMAGMLETASLAQRSMANKLLMEHEMGELFKVIGFCRGAPWNAIGFAHGDRSHTL